MIEDTIRKIEESLRTGANAPAREAELRRLLAELKSELTRLEVTRRAEAHRIAALTGAAHETARSGGDAGQRRQASNRLAEAVREFEASHPKLTSIVDAIAESLASAGI